MDFTNPQSVLKNSKTAILAGVVPVVGTTGLDESEIEEIRALVDKEGCRCVFCSEFFDWGDFDDAICQGNCKIFSTCGYH